MLGWVAVDEGHAQLADVACLVQLPRQDVSHETRLEHPVLHPGQQVGSDVEPVHVGCTHRMARRVSWLSGSVSNCLGKLQCALRLQRLPLAGRQSACFCVISMLCCVIIGSCMPQRLLC